MNEVFATDGPLAATMPGYRQRSGQIDMANDVAEAVAERALLCAEAGTGVGKTFAYLVPILRSGQRAIIATHTKSLQDQLYFGDLPRLQEALGDTAEIALLKGRANYYCHARAEQAQGKRRQDGALLASLRHWAASHSSGDLDQFDGLPDDWPLRSQVTSNSENCLGNECPFLDQCFVNQARQKAAKARVVVANHHLLAADLALKDQGFGDLLQRAGVVVVDEAHKWAEVLGLFFGFSLSSHQLRELYADCKSLPITPFSAGVEAQLATVLEQMSAFIRAVPGRHERLSRADCQADERIRMTFQDLLDALQMANAAAEELGADGTEEEVLQFRLAQMHGNAQNWLDAPGHQAVCWWQRTQRGFVLQALPLDVADLSRAGFVAQAAAWVYVSATLSIAGDFSHLRLRLGLDEARCERYPSPFDYSHQSRLYVPAHMGPPGHGPQHTQAVMQAARPLLDAAQGGAFILCTSRRAVLEAAQILRDWGEWPVHVQGEESNGLLLERFRRHGHAVLVGSASFWEGVDVPGPALRLVVIDRLPFASPQDPVLKSRRLHAQDQGLSPFSHVDLPPAAVALQQAVGRLLRTENDFGLVMLGDTRLITKGYGRILRRSLPPMPVVTEAAEAVAFMRECPRESAA